MTLRRTILALAVFVIALTALDLAVGRFALRDGTFLGRPVPPYGDMREARWQDWARRRLAAGSQQGDESQALRTDAKLGWTNAPGFCSADGKRRFNSKGLRGATEFAPMPAPGVRRVALFGESFVYGEEVDDGEEFAAQLVDVEPRLEVMNFGVSGYGTDQALMRLELDGRDCHAQVVCIGVMLENIVRNVSRLTRLRNPYVKGLGVKPRYRLVHDALELVPSPFATELEAASAVIDGSLTARVRDFDAFAELDYDSIAWRSSLARLYMGWQGSRARDYRRAWRDTDGEAFTLLIALLKRFDALARERGAERTLVLVFPTKEDLALAIRGEERFWRTLAPALEVAGIESFDVTDALIASARRSAPAGASPERTTAEVYLRAHWNVAGNRAVAEALAPRLLAP